MIGAVRYKKTFSSIMSTIMNFPIKQKLDFNCFTKASQIQGKNTSVDVYVKSEMVDHELTRKMFWELLAPIYALFRQAKFKAS